MDVKKNGNFLVIQKNYSEVQWKHGFAINFLKNIFKRK